jgi:5'-3' exonuclease
VADRLALVGDAADGFPGLPGWGDKSASAVLARYGTLEAIPPNGAEWDVVGLRNPVGLAATLRDQMAAALLFRDLARLRTTADGVDIPEQDVDELEWRGADRSTWEAFCDEWELPRLRARPHRWRAA